MKAWTLPLLLAVCLPADASAQTRIPSAGETIEVSIVNVDVVVTDRHGNHIRGLTAADFEIRDNGVPQPITNFAEYNDDGVRGPATPAPAEGGAPTAVSAPQRAREKRTLVLFVERQVLKPAQADSFVASLKKLLHETMRTGDTAAVVSFRFVPKVEQDFTGDLTRLEAAIDRLRPMFDRFGENIEGEVIRNAYLQELDAEVTAAGGGSADLRTSPTLKGTDRAQREFLDIRRKVQMLNMLVNVMAGVDGRKAIFLATRRFGKYAGCEFICHGLGPPNDDMLFFDTEKLRESLTRNANAAGVTFYPVYPEGVVEVPLANVEQGRLTRSQLYGTTPISWQRLGQTDVVVLNETKSIGDLAARTGGVVGWGFGDVAKIASAVREDLGAYYSLAFRTPKGMETHKITVKSNHGYTVRARSEVVEKTDEMMMSDRVLAALYQPQRGSAIPVDVQVLGKKKVKLGYRIPIVIRIPAASLTALPDAGGRSGVFRVYCAAGGTLGVNSDVHEQSQPFTIPAGAKDAATKIFTYSFEMLTDTRSDRIVIGIYDDLSKQYGVVRVMLD